MGLFDIDIIEKSPCLADSYKIIKRTRIDNGAANDVFRMNFSGLQDHLIELYRKLDEPHRDKLKEEMFILSQEECYQRYVIFMMICMYSNPDNLSTDLTYCLTQQRRNEGSFVEVSIQYNYEGSKYTKLTVRVVSVYGTSIELILEPI